MVFWETTGDNDFRSLFPSVAEEVREDEERKQTEMFLKLLEDIDSRSPKDSQESDGGGHSRGSTREFLKVSITDPEKAERENNEEKTQAPRARFHGKVHTLDDLPPDELDFASLFGVPPAPEPPEMNFEAGRRLSDGKIKYSASLPPISFAAFGFPAEMQGFSIQVEYVLIGVLLVFLLGIWLGRKATQNRFQRELRRVHTNYASQMHAMHSKINTLTQQPPVYMPVPMVMSPGTNTSEAAAHFFRCGQTSPHFTTSPVPAVPGPSQSESN